MKRCHFSDLARFDRSDPPQTSSKTTPKRIREKVMVSEKNRENEKLQKRTLAILHTCTKDFAVLRAQSRQSASWALWSTLALPNRPSRTFAYVYEGFGCSGSPKRTSGALGPDFEKCWSPGRRTLNRGGGPPGGGFPTLPLSSRTLLSLLDRTAPQPIPIGCGAENVLNTQHAQNIPNIPNVSNVRVRNSHF